MALRLEPLPQTRREDRDEAVDTGVVPIDGRQVGLRLAEATAERGKGRVGEREEKERKIENSLETDHVTEMPLPIFLLYS